MNNKYKILIIEDDAHIKNLITALLESDGYHTITASNCSGGQMLFASHRPDLVILDLGLPDADGTVFLREIRRENTTPVIVLSARSDEGDKVSALDMGANDYVTKPFSPAELMARIRSALRNSHTGELFTDSKFESNGLLVDYESRRVFINGAEIKFTQTEFNIVALLSRYPGKVMTYTAIIRAIWGYNDLGSTKKLQVNMANIRKKFGDKPGKKNYIVNELGVGYRMCEKN